MAKPAQQTNNRSDARSQATTAGQTSGSGRRPGPRDDTQSGQQTSGGEGEAISQFDPTKHSLIVVAPNPKREGTIAFDYYEGYPKPGVLSDMFKTRKGEHCAPNSKYKEVRGKDISWDADPVRRHILTGQDALDFDKIAQGDPFGKNRNACSEFLKTKMKIPEKSLIKWGYMDKPAPAPVEEKKETETA
jgi:hypothetical protein